MEPVKITSVTENEGNLITDVENQQSLYDRFYESVSKLRNETQIPHKYPNRAQEYAVYKRGGNGGYSKVETVTVNGTSMTESALTRLLMTINRQPIFKFADQIKIFTDNLTDQEFEAFKQRSAE